MNETHPPKIRPDPASLSSLRAIQKEHAVIRDLLHQLETTRELGPLLAELRRLEPLLRKHFSIEEAPGGLCTILHEQGSFQQLDRLLNEHAAFLSAVNELEAMIQKCLEGPLAEVRRRVTELVMQIRAHEARETDVLTESLSTDQGALD